MSSEAPTPKSWILIAAALSGILIAWIDSRPHWDDTGITAGAIVLAAGITGALRPRQAWLVAILVGAWVPLFELVQSRNYGSLLALGIAMLAAFAGAGLSRVVRSERQAG